MKEGVLHGNHEGSVYLIFFVALFYFAYKIFAYKNTDKNKAWIYGCWLFAFCSMLLALIFVYDIQYGARHAIGFVFLFIIIFSFGETSFPKYMVVLVVCVWLFCIQTREVNICPIPVYTEEKADALQKGREELIDAGFIDYNSDNPWDNTIIWLYGDETVTDFTYFYALPAGTGIQLYFKEDGAVRRFEELQSKYIMTNIGEEMDSLCEKENKEIIAEYGNVHIWRIR